MNEYQYPAIYRTLNDDQKQAFQMMAYGYTSGVNFFLTGDAGTGKSYLIDAYYMFCAMNGISMLKCAPTGVAATNIGGVTMHRAFKLPLSVVPDKIAGNQFANIYKLLIRADVIFIDEISMARLDMFGCAMRQIQEAAKIRAKSGKNPAQVIVCGDFGQLPPVVTETDRNLYLQLTGNDIGTGCAYNSPWWDKMGFQPILLSKPMRQSDARFCKALDNLKMGIRTDIDYLNANTAPDPVDGGIWLCGYNDTAAMKNARGIYELPGQEISSKAVVTGKANIKQSNFVDDLIYKAGARVVMTMREPGNRNSYYDNGSLGTIRKAGRECVTVDLDNGRTVEVLKVKLPFYEYEVSGSGIEPREVGSIIQFPFKIGYAITIHKSQGQTYDQMNVVPEIFSPGQLYVAMSRCREIGKIHIQPDRYGNRITAEKIMPNPEVIRFLIDQDAKYAKFRTYFMQSLYQADA